MKFLFKMSLIVGALALLSTDVSAKTSVTSEIEAPAESTFVKKRYNINGTWNVTELDGQKTIHFGEDFKTKGGPDLKLYLSTSNPIKARKAILSPTKLIYPTIRAWSFTARHLENAVAFSAKHFREKQK